MSVLPSFVVDGHEFGYAAQAFSHVPEELRKQLRPRFRAIGERMKAQAAANASWSSRIPGSLKVRVSLAGKRPGVYVLAEASSAPHARPLEGLNGRNPFRHPVFGNENVWVAQSARPYLLPALMATREQSEADLRDALVEAFRATGAAE